MIPACMCERQILVTRCVYQVSDGREVRNSCALDNGEKRYMLMSDGREVVKSCAPDNGEKSCLLTHRDLY